MDRQRQRQRLEQRAEHLRQDLARVETALAELDESGEDSAPAGAEMKGWEDERSRLLDELRRERQLLRTVLNQVPAEVVAVDARGNVILQSERFRAQHPFAGSLIDEAQMRGGEDGGPHHGSSLLEVLRSGRRIEGEPLTIGPEGHERYLRLYVTPLSDGDTVEGAVATTLDVTDLERGAQERQRLLEDVQRERALLEAIVSQMPGTTMITLPPHGELMYVHDKILNLRIRPGKGEHLTQPRSPFEIETLDGQPILPEDWPTARALRGETIFGRRERLRFAGMERIISVYSQPVLNEAGEIVAAVMTHFDVTEQVQAEEELRQHRDHLADLVRQRTAELEANNAQLRRQRQNLRRLSAELAAAQEHARETLAMALHDTAAQTLAAAGAQAHLAADDLPDERAQAHLVKLSGLIRQAIGEVRDVISELSPAQRNMTLALGLQDLSQGMEARHGYSLEVRLPPEGLPEIEPQVVRAIHRSVRELLTNTAKHAEAKTVSISCAIREHNLFVLVEDDGRGFDSTLVQTGPAGGFGLFSIAEHLAHFGGRMEIESQPGQGARFTLIVPLAAPSSEDPAAH